MFALYQYLRAYPDTEVCTLLHMKRATSAHGFGDDVIMEQASAMGLRLTLCPVGDRAYEDAFRSALQELKDQGVSTGIFGDIYLETHKVWVERVCLSMGVEPIFPLWGQETSQLIRDFVEAGFKTLIVAMRTDLKPDLFLGRVIDSELIAQMGALSDIDLCGEHGEYHTYVFDGPLFERPARYISGQPCTIKKHLILPIYT